MVQVIPPNEDLKRKSVGVNGISREEAMRRSQQVVEQYKQQYENVLEEDLKKITALTQKLLTEKDKTQEHAKKIYGLAHEMKGQGGTFGYDLVTAIADSLCKVLTRVPPEHPNLLVLVSLHVDSIRIVVRDSLKGLGGDKEQAMLTGLIQARDFLTAGIPDLENAVGIVQERENM